MQTEAKTNFQEGWGKGEVFWLLQWVGGRILRSVAEKWRFEICPCISGLEVGEHR